VKKRDARSAKGKLRDDLKKESDDLDCRWEELRKCGRELLGQPIESPARSEWLDKAYETVQQRIANKMRQEALDWLPKSGPKQNADESKPVDKYLLLMQDCLAASHGNMRSARIRFMKEATTRFGVAKGTAENNWYRLRDAAK
jgi:hypothetical protein